MCNTRFPYTIDDWKAYFPEKQSQFVYVNNYNFNSTGANIFSTGLLVWRERTFLNSFYSLRASVFNRAGILCANTSFRKHNTGWLIKSCFPSKVKTMRFSKRILACAKTHYCSSISTNQRTTARRTARFVHYSYRVNYHIFPRFSTSLTI